jgi:endonuclease-3
MNAAKRAAIFARLAAANPHPQSELRFTTPYELLVAVILSAQATDKSVNVATKRLFQVANTAQAMVELGVPGLEAYIKTIGLYHNKAKNVVEMSRRLLEEHGGEVPRTREALEALPGVGRKTANVVLNTAFGQETFAVDTHIFRVCNRTGLAPGKTPREVEDGLEKCAPAPYRRDAHHWLILHGRYTCIARKPDCPRCVIREWCEYRQKTPADDVQATTRSRVDTTSSSGAAKATAAKVLATTRPAKRPTTTVTAGARPRRRAAKANRSS